VPAVVGVWTLVGTALRRSAAAGGEIAVSKARAQQSMRRWHQVRHADGSFAMGDLAGDIGWALRARIAASSRRSRRFVRSRKLSAADARVTTICKGGSRAPPGPIPKSRRIDETCSGRAQAAGRGTSAKLLERMMYPRMQRGSRAVIEKRCGRGRAKRFSRVIGAWLWWRSIAAVRRSMPTRGGINAHRRTACRSRKETQRYLTEPAPLAQAVAAEGKDVCVALAAFCFRFWWGGRRQAKAA